MLKRLIAYYLPFDTALAFQASWIWQHARQYAYRNGIACLALVAIALMADAYHLAVVYTTAHALAIATAFFATVFTAAAFDPRLR